MRRFKILLLVVSMVVAAGCGGKAKPSGLAFPEGPFIKQSAQGLMVMDFASLLSANMSNDLGKAQMQSALNQMGLKMEEIERIVVSMPITPSILSGDTPPFLAITKLNSGADIASLKKQLESEPASKTNGKTYYVSPTNTLAAYLHEGDKLLVIGTEPQVKEALGDGPSSQFVGKLEANVNRTMYAYADLTQVRAELSKGVQMLGLFAAPLQEPVKNLTAASLMYDLEGATLIEARLEMADATAAEGVKTSLNGLLDAGKGMISARANAGANDNKVPPAQKDANELAQELVESIKIEVAGTSVTVTVAKPRDFVNRLRSLQSGTSMFSQ